MVKGGIFLALGDCRNRRSLLWTLVTAVNVWLLLSAAGCYLGRRFALGVGRHRLRRTAAASEAGFRPRYHNIHVVRAAANALFEQAARGGCTWDISAPSPTFIDVS